MLYMFQAVASPIIRRSQMYIQHRVFVISLLLPAAIVDELELIHNSSSSSKSLTNTRCCMYICELLMMGEATA